MFPDHKTPHNTCEQVRSERTKILVFFILSGEHPTLPFSELLSILEAEGKEYRVVEKLWQALRVEGDVNVIRTVVARAALTRYCCIELFICDADHDEILRTASNASFEPFLNSGESFVVRTHRIRGSSPHIMGLKLEQDLGNVILKNVQGTKVSLILPQKTFLGVFTQKKFIFGLKKAEIRSRVFRERDPRKRPFFHPTALSAKIARCMVNLVQPKATELVFDPFCGAASILVEAGLIGCRVMGLDVQRHMVRGGLQNLRFYHIKPDGMVVADAQHPPLSEVDHIVTDPPYGRASTTLGKDPEQIIKSFLSIAPTFHKGKRICIAAPKTISVGKIGKELGLRHVESHSLYIHKSLTREIAVFETG